MTTQVARINGGEPSSRAMEPGTRKMPTPIVVPITMQVESSNPSCRRSSVRVVVAEQRRAQLVLYKSVRTEVSIAQRKWTGQIRD